MNDLMTDPAQAVPEASPNQSGRLGRNARLGILVGSVVVALAIQLLLFGWSILGLLFIAAVIYCVAIYVVSRAAVSYTHLTLPTKRIV